MELEQAEKEDAVCEERATGYCIGFKEELKIQ